MRDYFLSLPEPLTTFALFDFFLDSWVKAEAVAAAQVTSMEQLQRQQNQQRHFLQQQQQQQQQLNHQQYLQVRQENQGRYQSKGCQQHPGSGSRPCSRPLTISEPDTSTPRQGPSETDSQFYTMSEAGSEDFLGLGEQERVARIRQTFTVMPPLATSSVRGNSTTNTSGNSSNTTMFSTASSLSPNMSATAIMRNFLPPNTCFETVFMESSPVTRIVPQAHSEVLHLSRSCSSRSLAHISSGPLPTRCSGTQTEDGQQPRASSLKRVPRWKRSSRLRKSVAVMEAAPLISGRDNPGYSGSPPGQEQGRRLCSASVLPGSSHPEALRQGHSLDNLLDREQERRQFLLKYRQVSGDLRRGGDLVAEARMGEELAKRERSPKESGALTPALRRMRLEEAAPHCYDNPGLEQTPQAPLASQECDLSPVSQPFQRNTVYNSSYRLATLQPSQPTLPPSQPAPRLPRTSTRLSLAKPQPPPKPKETAYARSLPARQEPKSEAVYTIAGPGPLRRYGAPLRASGRSVATTVDSGRSSLAPEVRAPPPALGALQLLALLLPPGHRRKLQLLLKFILKISMNCDLSLSSSQSNASLCLDTFLGVVLRPRDQAFHHSDIARRILQVTSCS